jgi:predicted lipase
MKFICLVIVSFRGTNPISIQNWVDDFQYQHVAGHFVGLNVSVHYGFQHSYEQHAAKVWSSLSSLLVQYPSYKLVITGHSLGGAMATICAMDLVYNRKIKTLPFLVTFGSPRVGDLQFSQAFSKMYTDRSWRVTNQHDIVPHVPLERMGFEHVPLEVWLDTNTHFYIASTSVVEDPSLSDSGVHLSVLNHLNYLQVQYIPCLI